VCRRTTWSARTGARQRKWSTSPTVPGMPALSIGAPLASRWVGSRVVVLMRLCLQLALVCSPFCAITYKFQSDMRALASDRVLPRTKISALRVAVITMRPTTRASCRDLLAWSAMSIVRAISLRWGSTQAPKGVSAVARYRLDLVARHLTGASASGRSHDQRTSTDAQDARVSHCPSRLLKKSVATGIAL
jgi:hypothetical protein